MANQRKPKVTCPACGARVPVRRYSQRSLFGRGHHVAEMAECRRCPWAAPTAELPAPADAS